jgi:hypothetical protein
MYILLHESLWWNCGKIKRLSRLPARISLSPSELKPGGSPIRMSYERLQRHITFSPNPVGSGLFLGCNSSVSWQMLMFEYFNFCWHFSSVPSPILGRFCWPTSNGATLPGPSILSMHNSPLHQFQGPMLIALRAMTGGAHHSGACTTQRNGRSHCPQTPCNGNKQYQRAESNGKYDGYRGVSTSRGVPFSRVISLFILVESESNEEY